MGKTYEALKRAEEERQSQAPSSPEVQPARPTNLPAPAGRSWFRFGRRDQNGSTKNGHSHNGHGNGNGNGNGNGSPFKHASSPTTIEEFQQLRKNLLATKAARPLQFMLVVSSRHGEGATTTTALLGSTMAQAGRCLLIDANFRTPGLTRHFSASDAAGVCEALADDPAARRIHYLPTDVPNLYFMPTGRGPARIPYLFEGRAFDELVSTLRRDFDSILIDGAPMEMYADSAFLAPRADGVILVIGAETTPLYGPATSLRELERVGAQILGAVLNRRQDFIPRFIDRFSNPQDVVEVAIVQTGEPVR